MSVICSSCAFVGRGPRHMGKDREERGVNGGEKNREQPCCHTGIVSRLCLKKRDGIYKTLDGRQLPCWHVFCRSCHNACAHSQDDTYSDIFRCLICQASGSFPTHSFFSPSTHTALRSSGTSTRYFSATSWTSRLVTSSSRSRIC